SCCLRQRRGNSGITGIGNPNLSYAINSEIIFLVWLYGQNRTGQGHYKYQPSTYRNHFRYRAYRFDFLHYCLPLSVVYQKICTEGLQPRTPEKKATEAVFTGSVKQQPLQIGRGVRKRVSRKAHPVPMRPTRTEW